MIHAIESTLFKQLNPHNWNKWINRIEIIKFTQLNLHDWSNWIHDFNNWTHRIATIELLKNKASFSSRFFDWFICFSISLFFYRLWKNATISKVIFIYLWTNYVNDTNKFKYKTSGVDFVEPFSTFILADPKWANFFLCYV